MTISLEALAKQWIDQSESSDTSQVQEDRLKAQDYFYGRPFGNERDGLSDYVSRDTFDVVQDSTAFFVETFLRGDDVAFFAPKGREDVPLAKLRTRYANRVLEEDNNRFIFLHDSVQTAFLSKNCVCKVFVEEEERVEKDGREGLTPADVELLEAEAARQDFEIEEIEEFDDGTASVTMSRKVTDRFIKVEVLPPERFIIDPEARSIEEARCVGEWSEVTRSELLEMGFDAEKVRALTEEQSTSEIEEESRENFNNNHADIGDKSQDKLKLYELYILSDQDGDGIAELHQVFYCNGKELDSDEVTRHGYHGWAAVRVAHRWDGLSAYDLVGDIQLLKSTYQRMIADHLVRSNNQSMFADYQALVNPQALIENEIGSIHWTNGGALAGGQSVAQPVTQPQLSPMTMPAIEQMEREKEARSGKTRLSVGQNAEVIGQQNSTSLIDNQTDAALRRLMMAARSFAETYLIPVMREIFDLAVEHELPAVEEEVDGEWLPLDPKQLGSSRSMRVHPALTSDEKRNRVQFLLAMHNTLSPPGMPAHPLYQPENQHAVLREIFDQSGQMNPMFLTNPGNGQFQSLNGQLQQAGQQIQQMQQTIQQLQAALADKGQKEAADLAVKNRKLDQDYEIANRKQALAEDAEAHDQVMDDMEIALERSQGRPVSV